MPPLPDAERRVMFTGIDPATAIQDLLWHARLMALFRLMAS